MADYKKPDHWQLKARKEGYPARSVYKLMEIDEKFSLFNSRAAVKVLDIGAAPGSWSLYVLRKFNAHKKGFLAAADLLPLSREFDNDARNRVSVNRESVNRGSVNHDAAKSDSLNQSLFEGGNFFFIQGDVTTEPVRQALLSKGPYNVIISDAAPNTTGNHMIDAARSHELVETVISYAQTALVPGGNLAVKIFQGSGTDEILKRLKGLFKTAKSFKPAACRGESVETYFAGLGFINK